MLKSINKKSCKKCGSNNLRSIRTTVPVIVEGKQLNVGRVSVKECIDCYSIMPTKAGLEKIERCSVVLIDLLKRAGTKQSE